MNARFKTGSMDECQSRQRISGAGVWYKTFVGWMKVKLDIIGIEYFKEF